MSGCHSIPGASSFPRRQPLIGCATAAEAPCIVCDDSSARLRHHITAKKLAYWIPDSKGPQLSQPELCKFVALPILKTGSSRNETCPGHAHLWDQLEDDPRIHACVSDLTASGARFNGSYKVTGDAPGMARTLQQCHVPVSACCGWTSSRKRLEAIGRPTQQQMHMMLIT